MKKVKQILAMLGVILLVSLYVITLICAITDNSATQQVFMASLFATVVIPVLLWAYMLVYRLIKKNSEECKEQGKLNHEDSSIREKANLSGKTE